MLIAWTDRVMRLWGVTMRPVRITAAFVFAAAVAITGCTAHSAGNRADTPAAPAAAAPTAPAASPTTDGQAGHSGATTSQPVVLADGRHPVFLKTVEPYRQTITFDLVQWYEGQAAAREAAKDHLEADNDYYIRNSSSKLRTLPVLDGATITVNQLTGSNQGVPVSLAKLSTWFPRATAGPMFWITVHDGHVSQISEQWVP
jgi:hypothetical protein